jgi:hypothetical protein
MPAKAVVPDPRLDGLMQTQSAQEASRAARRIS